MITDEETHFMLVHTYMNSSVKWCVFCVQLLGEIEDHLKCTITQCEPDIKVPLDEFDGKVTYGQRRATGGVCMCARVHILTIINYY